MISAVTSQRLSCSDLRLFRVFCVWTCFFITENAVNLDCPKTPAKATFVYVEVSGVTMYFTVTRGACIVE